LAEYTVQSLSPCYGLLTALVLLDMLTVGEIQHNLLQKCCDFVIHGRRKDVFQGGTSGFFQTFFWGCPKVMKFVFYQWKLRKQLFFWKFHH